MQEIEEQISYRQHDQTNEREHNFIYATWSKENYETYPYKFAVKSKYMARQHKIIDETLLKSNIIVCCNKNEPDQIYAYVIFEQVEDATMVHYIYVKKDFRNFGFATELMYYIDPKFKSKTILVSALPRLDKSKVKDTYEFLTKFKLSYSLVNL